jgi:nucleotide-binding universal stress UspA family protein
MYRNILVPIDLLEPSSWQKALPIAAELSRAFGAQIHVTTVVMSESFSSEVHATTYSVYSLAINVTVRVG